MENERADSGCEICMDNLMEARLEEKNNQYEVD